MPPFNTFDPPYFSICSDVDWIRGNQQSSVENNETCLSNKHLQHVASKYHPPLPSKPIFGITTLFNFFSAHMDEEEDSDPSSLGGVIVMGHAPAEQPAAGLTYSSSSPPSGHAVQLPTRNPFWRLSPWHNGSVLYDLYELKAVTHQLNKAIQQASAATAPTSSPPFASHVNSPYCRQLRDSIYKQNTKMQRRISSGQVVAAVACDGSPSAGGAKGFVTRLWKKLKQGFFRSKQKNDTGSKVCHSAIPGKSFVM